MGCCVIVVPWEEARQNRIADGLVEDAAGVADDVMRMQEAGEFSSFYFSLRECGKADERSATDKNSLQAGEGS